MASIVSMYKKLRVQLAGTVVISDDLEDGKVIHFNAHEQLSNFNDWEYLDRQGQTILSICMAFDSRKFTEKLPLEGSHVIIRGMMDEYTLNAVNHMEKLWVIVHSLEVLCMHRVAGQAVDFQ
jgi:hypothetical protein